MGWPPSCLVDDSLAFTVLWIVAVEVGMSEWAHMNVRRIKTPLRSLSPPLPTDLELANVVEQAGNSRGFPNLLRRQEPRITRQTVQQHGTRTIDPHSSLASDLAGVAFPGFAMQ